MVTVTAYPFESQAVGEGQYGALANLWLPTGVVRHQLNELSVFADSSGMQVKVRDGRAVIRGVFIEVPSQQTLPISGANASLPRKDLVVLRVDYVQNRVDLDVKTGTAAASPAVPTLTQSGTIWETGLAEVLIDAAAVTIAAGKITDRRHDQAFFGWAGNRYSATNMLSTAKPATWPEGGLIYLTDTDVLEVNIGSYTTPTWAVVYPQSISIGGTPTTILPNDAANAGVASTTARSDHKHAITTGTPITQAYNDTPAEGSSNAFSRADHKHGMPAVGAISFGSPGSSAVGDSAADGAAGTASRSDHRHAREAFGVPALTLGISNSAGVAPSPLRSDAAIAIFDSTVPADLASGSVAATGSSNRAARRDHVHGMPVLDAASTIVKSRRTNGTQSVASSVTTVDITGLDLPFGPNQTWVGYWMLSCSASSTVPDYQWRVRFSLDGAGASFTWMTRGPTTSETNTYHQIYGSPLRGIADFSITASIVGVIWVEVPFLLESYSNGGQVTLQFAQNNSDPSAVTIQPSSFLIARKA